MARKITIGEMQEAAMPGYQVAIDLDHFSAVLTTCSTKVQQP